MNFDEVPEFQKDLKQLTKRWRSIPNDIEVAKKYIVPLYQELSDDVSVELYRQDFFNGKNAAILHSGVGYEVIKMRLDVADLKRNDKTRLIFIAIKTESTIRLIELYAKNDKHREDVARIKRYIGYNNK